MKCVRKGTSVRRVSNGHAKQLVKQGWSTTTKGKWKSVGRPPRGKEGKVS